MYFVFNLQARREKLNQKSNLIGRKAAFGATETPSRKNLRWSAIRHDRRDAISNTELIYNTSVYYTYTAAAE